MAGEDVAPLETEPKFCGAPELRSLPGAARRISGKRLRSPSKFWKGGVRECVCVRVCVSEYLRDARGPLTGQLRTCFELPPAAGPRLKVLRNSAWLLRNGDPERGEDLGGGGGTESA